MARPSVYSASDYAGMVTPNAKFYYGYEETDENDEWCFTAEIPGLDLIKVPNSKLQAEDRFNCEHCLMMGIAWVLTKYPLNTKG